MAKVSKYISQEQQEVFEKFLLGQMTPEEEIKLHKELGGDSKLKSQFEEFKIFFFAVEEEGLRNSLVTFHEKFESSTKGQSAAYPKQKVFFMAASIAALVAFGITLFLNRPTQGERLFDEYFKPDPGLPTVMGETQNFEFLDAMVDYKRGNYDIAIEKWKKLLPQKPENDTLNYFLGSAYLANGNTHKAIGYLTSLTDNDKSVFYDDINLYLGLALLKNEEFSKAESVLAKSNSPKSKSILSNLK